MSYNEKKQELLKLRSEVLADYQILLEKTMRYSIGAKNLIEECTTPFEVEDWGRFIVQEVSSDKAARLLSSLMYVEHPEDKLVYKNLKDNMKANRRR